MRQTPYWTKRQTEVKLTTADRVCLVLKINNGSWQRFIKQRRQEAQRREDRADDLKRAIRIHEFEKKHKIRFVQDGGNLCDFYWTPVKRK